MYPDSYNNLFIVREIGTVKIIVPLGPFVINMTIIFGDS